MNEFAAKIEIIGINPFVFVPQEILESIFLKAGKGKGPIPVRGTINGVQYTQTLVKYAGEWRLYINTTMLKDSPKRVGELVPVVIDYDPSDRTLPIHPLLQATLDEDIQARQVFESLPPSRRHEINRYISHLKSEAAIQRNVQRAVDFLNGKGRFIGRDPS